jgi:hypothetical protein
MGYLLMVESQKREYQIKESKNSNTLIKISSQSQVSCTPLNLDLITKERKESVEVIPNIGGISRMTILRDKLLIILD